MNSSFRVAFTMLTVAVTLWLCIATIQILPALVLSMRVARESVPYQTAPRAETMLVVGDSTAYGLGAYQPHESTAGRVSQALNLGVENNARSGARTREMVHQLRRARESKYELILMQIGANDVMKFSSIEQTAAELDAALALAKERSDKVVLLTAGDIGAAPIWPWLLGDVYTNRTELLRERFISIANKYGVAYVDLYTLPDPLPSDVEKYFTPDTLHPSSEGYAIWSGYILDSVKGRWGEWYEERTR